MLMALLAISHLISERWRAPIRVRPDFVNMPATLYAGDLIEIRSNVNHPLPIPALKVLTEALRGVTNRPMGTA